MKKPKVSVVIPVYNEEKDIKDCLGSLLKQSYKNFEVIIVDDGSTDESADKIKKYPVKLLKQKHKGSGAARNLGVKYAIGEILVFVDADQTFDKRFIDELIKPILRNKTKGTFTKEEFISNADNVWSKCLCISEGRQLNRRTRDDYPEESKAFRAIRKDLFLKAGGFDENKGITDDSIADKVGFKAVNVSKAIYYHKNPDTLKDIFIHANWVGKGEHARKNILVSCLAHLFPFSIVRGLFTGAMKKNPYYLIFKMVFDLGIIYGLTKAVLTRKYHK